MPRLTKIYTRTGDNGTTALVGNTRTHKTDPRIIALSAVDELNSCLGVALAHAAANPAHAELFDILPPIQSRLFDLGADLATPAADHYTYPPVRIHIDDIPALEATIDRINSKLPPLTSFIMPGGNPVAAALHMARTIARRAEINVWTAGETHKLFDPTTPEVTTPGAINIVTARYLNRLADLLFVLARHANRATGTTETLWTPNTSA